MLLAERSVSMCDGVAVGIGAAGCGKCAVGLRCSAACHTSKENANCCQCIQSLFQLARKRNLIK